MFNNFSELDVFSCVVLLFVATMIHVEVGALLRSISFANRSKYKGWTKVRYVWLRYIWQSVVFHQRFARLQNGRSVWYVGETIMLMVALSAAGVVFKADELTTVQSIGGGITVGLMFFYAKYTRFSKWRAIILAADARGEWKRLVMPHPTPKIQPAVDYDTDD